MVVSNSMTANVYSTSMVASHYPAGQSTQHMLCMCITRALLLVPALCSRAACRELSPAVEELSLLLARGCEDAFPDAKKAAAAALVALAGRLPAGALEDQAERLLQVPDSCVLLWIWHGMARPPSFAHAAF